MWQAPAAALMQVWMRYAAGPGLAGDGDGERAVAQVAHGARPSSG